MPAFIILALKFLQSHIFAVPKYQPGVCLLDQAKQHHPADKWPLSQQPSSPFFLFFFLRKRVRVQSRKREHLLQVDTLFFYMPYCVSFVVQLVVIVF